jgi:hypothetical protein
MSPRISTDSSASKLGTELLRCVPQIADNCRLRLVFAPPSLEHGQLGKFIAGQRRKLDLVEVGWGIDRANLHFDTLFESDLEVDRPQLGHAPNIAQVVRRAVELIEVAFSRAQ